MSETTHVATASKHGRPAVGGRAATRDITIDTLRGIAIVLMVAGHVIGVDDSVGMKVDDSSGWRLSYELLADLRMPLFTALSGFVYAIRPVPFHGKLSPFIRGKARRLLVPLLTVGTAFVLLQALTPGTNSEVGVADSWRLYVYGLGHFWFLQAVFVILLLVGCLDAAGLLRTRRSLVTAIGIAAVLAVVTDIPPAWDVFSVGDALRLLPFFLVGYYFAGRATGKQVGARWLLLACAAALFTLRALEVFGAVDLVPLLSDTLSVTLGLTGIASLIAFRHRLRWQPAATLGFYSFSIYLLHVFGTAPTRMLLTRVDVDSEALIFIVCLVAGLALPVVFQLTIGRVRWVSWAFLGQKPQRRNAPAPMAA
jgi:fucose 4-O-acetylase-like acetyltransferase